jgi:hypothetical protein
MDQDLAVALGVLVLIVGTWGYALVSLYRVVLPALRTGILQARARTYSRAEQPVQFWLGVTVWIAMAVLLAYPAVMVGMQFWRRFIA